MKISIITVCYNSAATLETAIESVLGQTYQDIEYIVVDGGSTDGTVEMLRRYAAGKCGNAWNKHAPRTSTLVQSPNARLRPAELERGAVFRDGAAMRECANENADACLENQIRQSGTKALRQFLWISEPDEGMYDAINKGIRMATGDVVGILNADDVLSADDVIERVAQVFGGSASVDAIYGDIRFVANRKGLSLAGIRAEKAKRYYSSRHWRPWMLQWGFMPPHPSVYIRKECFMRLGAYALNYRIAADNELLIRFLRKARLHCVYVPLCFVDMRLGGMSTENWRSNVLLNQEIVRGNRENGYFCCLLMMMPKYFFKIWEYVLPRVGK